MPIPKPKPKQSKEDYISKCHKFLHNENKTRKKKRSNEQISGICFSIWRRKDYSETQIQDILEWYENKEAEAMIEYNEALGPEDFKDMTLKEMVNKLKGWEKERKELGYKSPPITDKQSKDIELASHINSLKYAIGERMAQEQKEELMKWYESKVGTPKNDGNGKGVKANKEPSWVKMARKFLASKKGNPKLREYWKKRLVKYEAGRK